MAEVLVSKQVAYPAPVDDRGEITSIHGGKYPSPSKLREPRSRLTIAFRSPQAGRDVCRCSQRFGDRILRHRRAWNRLRPIVELHGNDACESVLSVSSLLGLPTPDRPGKPGNVSGKVSIANNEISVNGEAGEGVGIMVVSVGDSEKPVEVEISGNTIRNTNQKGINMKQIGGRVRIERNIVTTSAVYTGPARGFIAGIHCGGSGTYLITQNRIDVADPNAAGIRLRAYPALGAAMEHATITDNDVTMSAPEGAVLGDGSAGIEIRGSARGNVVQRNTIRGRAKVALSMAPDKTGYPTGNTFDGNDQENFIAPLADGGKQK